MESVMEAQYARNNLHASILEALRATGKDPDALGAQDLMPIEEFHTLGPMATMALAQSAALSAADHVLDAGCGIGGPARNLARSVGCRVTGIDMTGQFCEIARDFNRRSGLADHIHVVQGDATVLPFAPASFDVAWTQHVAMNIADKTALYRELRRVVRPGGRLAFFDIVAGEGGPIHLPVPWADQAEWNFLLPAEEIRALVEGAGFQVQAWQDVTPPAQAFWQGAAAATQDGPTGPLGMHLLMSDLPRKFANMARNLDEDRIRLLRCVALAA